MYFDFVHYILQLKFFFLILESVLSSRRIVIIAAIHSHTHKSQAQELYRRFRSGFRFSTVVASLSSARTVLPVLLNCSHTFRCNYSTIHIYIHIMCYIYIYSCESAAISCDFSCVLKVLLCVFDFPLCFWFYLCSNLFKTFCSTIFVCTQCTKFCVQFPAIFQMLYKKSPIRVFCTFFRKSFCSTSVALLAPLAPCPCPISWRLSVSLSL